MSDQAQSLAVITGGASGIGLALAEAYAVRGHAVLLGDIDTEALASAKEKFCLPGAVVHTAEVDLRSATSVFELKEKAQSLGSIAAVCFNAGTTVSGTPIWNTDIDLFDHIAAVNLYGLFHSIRAFVPVLIEQRQPADVLITASMAGMVASGYSGAYSASKAAAVALAKALKVELASEAPYLNVAVLNPGMVKTNLMRTSASRLPTADTIPQDVVEGTHQALNELGVSPGEAASWALRALQQKRFWAFPPENDLFTGLFAAELKEMQDAIDV